MSYSILQGDVFEQLSTLPSESVHCVVTSPPYWGLRDYGVAGQIGLEKTPQEFVARMVEVFREIRRVLQPYGTCWVNLGDSYANDGKWGGETGGKQSYLNDANRKRVGREKRLSGFKPKDLCGIPWRVAFALQDDGWWLRQDIIWAKPNPMPESVSDRCTKAHEYVFLLTKSARYYFDADAIKEKANGDAHARGPQRKTGVNSRMYQDRDPSHSSERKPGVGPKASAASSGTKYNDSFSAAIVDLVDFRNKRSVWNIATQAYPEAHFATYPEELVRPCILAGSPIGGTVLDPFSGSGTTGVVALRHHRKFIGLELNPEYVALSRRRIEEDMPLFNQQGA